MIDLHCHILPGLDDGAPDLEAALAMARIALSDGITDLVATPHAFDGVFEVTRHRAEAALADLRAALERERIPLKLHLGSDCHLDERIFDPAHSDNVLTIAGSRYLLVEFPHEIVPPRVENVLFRLRAKGLVPILTHPERNAELQRPGGLDRLAAWRASGLLLQLTAASLTGGFGNAAKTVAENLLRRGLCDFVATDAHSPEWRPPVLSGAREVVRGLGGEEAAARVCEEGPGRVLGNRPLDLHAHARESKEPQKTRSRFW